MITTLLLVLLTAMTGGAAFAEQEKPKESSPSTVVFVCEHGAAKSVVAAAWFNKLASERHLPFHAVARGFRPQENLSESAVGGLRRDGVRFAPDKPQPLTARDASDAVRIVALDPPPASARSFHAEFFEVPAPKDGYERSRDAIVVHVREVLDGLQQHAQPQ
jgi:arsenate reductase (thioredoxin)